MSHFHGEEVSSVREAMVPQRRHEILRDSGKIVVRTRRQRVQTAVMGNECDRREVNPALSIVAFIRYVDAVNDPPGIGIGYAEVIAAFRRLPVSTDRDGVRLPDGMPSSAPLALAPASPLHVRASPGGL